MGLTKTDKDEVVKGDSNNDDTAMEGDNNSSPKDKKDEEVFEASKSDISLTKSQIEELNTRGLLSGDVKPIDTKGLEYVLNMREGLLVLPDLGQKGFAFRPRQLVNLTKLFKKDEILKSESLRVALRSEDLKAVKLSEVTQEDIKAHKSELDKLEEQFAISDEGTKIPLKVNRHNNPFLARLWDEEKKIVKEKRMNQQPLNLKEIPLHAEEVQSKYDIE